LAALERPRLPDLFTWEFLECRVSHKLFDLLCVERSYWGAGRNLAFDVSDKLVIALLLRSADFLKDWLNLAEFGAFNDLTLMADRQGPYCDKEVFNLSAA
jgi:hypothetical protein